MSYVEFGSTAFRGILNGATGFFRGSLTAQAVDAVDTVNIAGGQITYSTLVSYDNIGVSAGAAVLVANINVPDASAFVEIQCFAHQGQYVVVDGGIRVPTSKGNVNNRLCPHSELILLSGGAHQIYLTSAVNGVSAHGYIHVQYIRKTGG